MPKTIISIPEKSEWPLPGQTRQDIERDVIGFIHDQASLQGLYRFSARCFVFEPRPQAIPERIKLISAGKDPRMMTEIGLVRWRAIKPCLWFTVEWAPLNDGGRQ